MTWRDKLIFVLVAVYILALAYMIATNPANDTDRAPAPTYVTEPPSASWEGLDAAQLSWVIEGIQERICELQHDLSRAQALQLEKMSSMSAG